MAKSKKLVEQRAFPFPTGPTLLPFNMAGRTLGAGGTDASLLGGIVTAFAQFFAAIEPEPEIDTDIETRAVQQQQQQVIPTYGYTTAYEFLRDRLVLAQTRRKVYEEYDHIEMDFPEVGSALDIYADNVCSTDAFSEDIVSIITDNETVGALFIVLKQILNLDKLLWTRAREITRVGEHFDEIVYGLTGFVERLKPMPAAYMIRNEDEFGLLPFEKAFTQINDAFQPEVEFGSWQIAHYRLLRKPDDKYGTGLLYTVQRLARKLQLAEDAMLIARLTRAHKKLLFGIPVDGLSSAERRKYVNEVKREYRKRRVINPRTQKLDLEANPLAAEDDIYIGYTKDNEVKVTEIGGDPSIASIVDIEFWQNKLFSALKVPKAYIGIERDVNAKATLTEQDVQFARTVHRIQIALQEGIGMIMDRAMQLFGLDPKENPYTLAFPAISLIDELRNWEIENMKLQAAFQFADLFRPDDRWMLIQYLGFSPDEADELLANQQPPPEEVPPPGQQQTPPPEEEEGGEEEGEEEEEPAEAWRNRRLKKFEAFKRRMQTVYAMGQRSRLRQVAVDQARARKGLASEMMKYRRLVHKNGSGY